MDEVDAALDEANQQVVAQLLKRLATCKNKNCQIFAVTHNAAFLGLCDQVFQVNSLTTS
jgi:chromosome segregation ATPase